MKTTNLCLFEGLGKERRCIFIWAIFVSVRIFFCFMGMRWKVWFGSVWFIPENWAEIFIKSQLKQLIVLSWSSDQSWICARGHERGGSICSICIWRCELQPWSQVLSISQCNSLLLWHMTSKMEQWIKPSSLFDTHTRQSVRKLGNTCACSQHVDFLQLLFNTECGCGNITEMKMTLSILKRKVGEETAGCETGVSSYWSCFRKVKG